MRVPHERIGIHTESVQHAIDEVEIADAMNCIDDLLVREAVFEFTSQVDPGNSLDW
jgi:hypothetical protein